MMGVVQGVKDRRTKFEVENRGYSCKAPVA